MLLKCPLFTFCMPETPLLLTVDQPEIPQCFPFASEIVAHIPDEAGILADPWKRETFIQNCQEVLDLIDEERQGQGIEPYDYNQRVILVFEFYRTLVQYNGFKPRKDGKDTFYDHLVGSVKNLVKMMGFTGLTMVLAVLKHDSVEDFVPKEAKGEDRKRQEAALYEGLINSSTYRHLLQNYDPRVEDAVTKDLRLLVQGVTKLRKHDREDEERASFDNYLRIAAVILKVVIVKEADRMQNVSTMGGHGDHPEGIAKQMEKMEETDEVHLGWGRVLRLREVTKYLVAELFEFSHRHQLSDKDTKNKFEKLQKERLAEKLEPFRKRILSQFDEHMHGMVTDVQFSLKGLEYYVANIDKPTQDIDIDELPIDPLDPMFNIVVTVPNPPSFVPPEREANERDDIYGKRVKAADKAYRESVLGGLLKVKNFILEKFDYGPTSNCSKPAVGDPLEMEGIKINLYNEDFGGQMFFSVNTTARERSLKRGVFAVSDDPEDIISHVRGLVGELGTEEISREAARREFLAPMLLVKDRGGRTRRFPRDAAGLDLARAIHTDVLVWQGRTRRRDRLVPDASGGDSLRPEDLGDEVSPLDPLEHGKVYIVELSETPLIEAYMARFAKGPTRSAMAAYFRGNHIQNEGERAEWCRGNGEKYLNKAAEVFSVGKDYILELIAKNTRPYKDVPKVLVDGRRTLDGSVKLKILEAIGRLEVDPVDFLVTLFDGRMKGRKEPGKERIVNEDECWQFEVILPDRVGGFNSYFSEFAEREGINIWRTKSHERNGSDNKLVYIIDAEGQNLSIEKFFNKLLKLNAKYSVRLTNNPYTRRKKRALRVVDVDVERE